MDVYHVMLALGAIVFSGVISFRLLAMGEDIFELDILNILAIFVAFICGAFGFASLINMWASV